MGMGWNYLYRYTVSVCHHQNASAFVKMGSGVRHFNVASIVRGKGTIRVSMDQHLSEGTAEPRQTRPNICLSCLSSPQKNWTQRPPPPPHPHPQLKEHPFLQAKKAEKDTGCRFGLVEKRYAAMDTVVGSSLCRLSFVLQKGGGVWTLSCDFVHHN